MFRPWEEALPRPVTNHYLFRFYLIEPLRRFVDNIWWVKSEFSQFLPQFLIFSLKIFGSSLHLVKIRCPFHVQIPGGHHIRALASVLAYSDQNWQVLGFFFSGGNEIIDRDRRQSLIFRIFIWLGQNFLHLMEVLFVNLYKNRLKGEKLRKFFGNFFNC